MTKMSKETEFNHEINWEQQEAETRDFKKWFQPMTTTDEINGIPVEIARQMGKVVPKRETEYFGTNDHYQPEITFEEQVFAELKRITRWQVQTLPQREYLSMGNDFPTLQEVLNEINRKEKNHD